MDGQSARLSRNRAVASTLIKVLNSRNAAHGLDSFPFYGPISHDVGLRRSVVDVLSLRSPSMPVLTSLFVCRRVWIMAMAPVARLSITVHCGQRCGLSRPIGASHRPDEANRQACPRQRGVAATLDGRPVVATRGGIIA